MSNPVLERLQRYGLQPRKELGQHFLVDPRTIDRLVARIAPEAGQTILEYGAGLGVLTERLLDAGAHVVAVELDDALAGILERELGARNGFRLIHSDLTRVDAQVVARDAAAPDLKLAGNLPYQLTSHVLFEVIELGPVLRDAVFMVQREVAERIVAGPGKRDYGIMSVLLQTWFDVEIVMRVKPGAFVPPPRVESAVLCIRPRHAGIRAGWDDRPALVRLVKSVFNERRKVLRNTLKKFYGLEADGLSACEVTSGIDLGRRPETLDPGEFVRLLRTLPGPQASGVVVPDAAASTRRATAKRRED